MKVEPKNSSPKKASEDIQKIEKAISGGRKLIESGETKITAAMHMFKLLNGENQETVVKAFVEGASLTPKGALTYWYNCRRRSLK